MHNGQQNPQKFSIQYAESMYSNPYSTLLVYLHTSVSSKHTYDYMLTSSIALTPAVETPTNARGTSVLQLGFSCGSTYLHFSSCLQLQQSLYSSGCTGWSQLQGPPHRSSHGRNGGLPGVTPHPYSQLPHGFSRVHLTL